MLNIHSESCLLYTIVIVSVPSRLFASTVPASTKNWGTTGKNINEVVENSQQQIDYIYSYIKFSTRTTGERRQLYQFMFLLPFRKAEWKSCEWTQYYKRVSGWERETKCQQYIIEECQSGWKRWRFPNHTHTVNVMQKAPERQPEWVSWSVRGRTIQNSIQYTWVCGYIYYIWNPLSDTTLHHNFFCFVALAAALLLRWPLSYRCRLGALLLWIWWANKANVCGVRAIGRLWPKYMSVERPNWLVFACCCCCCICGIWLWLHPCWLCPLCYTFCLLMMLMVRCVGATLFHRPYRIYF